MTIDLTKCKSRDDLISVVISLVMQEVGRAERQYPEWPDDIIHRAAIMAEESGEAVKAALDVCYSNGSQEDYIQELIQTAAMCIRNLIELWKDERQTKGR